jgi:hypothetical protein
VQLVHLPIIVQRVPTFQLNCANQVIVPKRHGQQVSQMSARVVFPDGLVCQRRREHQTGERRNQTGQRIELRGRSHRGTLQTSHKRANARMMKTQTKERKKTNEDHPQTNEQINENQKKKKTKNKQQKQKKKKKKKKKKTTRIQPFS